MGLLRAAKREGQKAKKKTRIPGMILFMRTFLLTQPSLDRQTKTRFMGFRTL
jgi:hypothetical protein